MADIQEIVPPTVYVGGTPIITQKKMREREKDDFYETDRACIDAYFRTRQFETVIDVLDPAAGTGVYGAALRARFPKIETITGVELKLELDPAPYYEDWHVGDFLKIDDFGRKFDLIVTNPPYKHAEEFFHHSVKHVNKDFGVISFLLRLGFLASERRVKTMWRAGFAPTNVIVLNTRPSFTGDGKTYPSDFAIFEWLFVDGKCMESQTFEFLTYKRGK